MSTYLLWQYFDWHFFGLDASQSCWIYPPSWNEILIYVAVVLKGIPQDLHYVIQDYCLDIAFFKPANLFVDPQHVLHLVVCSVCQWLVVCIVCLIFCAIPHIVLVVIYHLLCMFFVSAYLYQPMCHKFRICIVIQFNFINLFNGFICKYFIIPIWHCNLLYNVVVCNPLVCHNYSFRPLNIVVS